MEERQEGIVVEYAGFWMRLGAYLIDGIVLWIIGVILAVLVGLIALPFIGWGAMFYPYHVPSAYSVSTFHPLWFLFQAIWSLMGLIIPAAYFICFWALRGETLGMMALRIRVVRTDGSPPDWGAAVLRFIGYIICWFTAGLLFLWVAFDGRKQGLHDKMANTYAIVLPRRQAVLPEIYERGSR